MRIVRGLKQLHRVRDAFDFKKGFLKTITNPISKTNITQKAVELPQSTYDNPSLNKFDTEVYRLKKKLRKNQLSIEDQSRVQEMINGDLYRRNYRRAYKERAAKDAKTHGLGTVSEHSNKDSAQLLADQVAKKNKIEQSDMNSFNKSVKALRKQGLKL